MSRDNIEPAEEHKIIIHEHSYPDDSLVLELRPESHDRPWNSDMTRIRREDAENLKEKLEEVLGEKPK